ncbi:hypothetical protein J7K25_06975 [bacterium]|nr:hypothetical protein [bacterium]
MKKVLFSFFLLSAGFVFSASIFVESLSVLSSQKEITLPVKISSSETFSGFQFTVIYNKNVLDFEGVANGDIVSDYNVLVNEKREGFIKIAGFDLKLEGVSGEGVLVYIKFLIKNSGKSTLSLHNIKLTDKNGKKISCVCKSGVIYIEGTQQETEKQFSSSLPSESSSVSSTYNVFPPPGIKKEKVIKKEREISKRTYYLSSHKKEREKKGKTYNFQKGSFSSSSNNCVLLVMSEFGNPSPPSGFTTFNKGERISCKVEKEIPLNEMEKVVCAGYEGSGSAGNGTSNLANFVITKDSKIIWKWKKVPMEKTFSLKFNRNILIPYGKNKCQLPLTVLYYGGLKSKITFEKEKIPDGFEIKFPEISYEKKKGEILIKIDDKVKAGNYEISFSAISSDKKEIKKTYTMEISVEGLVEIKKKKEKNNAVVYFSSDKLGDFKNFFIEIGIKGRTEIKNITPENTDIIIRKNSVAVAGNRDIFKKLSIVLSGKIEEIKIERVKFIERKGKYIKVKTKI